MKTTKPERSRCPRGAASGCSERLQADRGFTLIEVLICTLILTVGMIAVAGLLLVTTQMQIGAREATRSTRLAQNKIDELMKLNFSSDPEVAVGGNLDADVTNYSETPADGITVRWAVTAGPTDDLRVLTLRVVNLHAMQYRETELTTIIRQW